MMRRSVREAMITAGAIWLLLAVFVFPRISMAKGATNADPEMGKQLFEKRCTGCHALDKNKEGPHLRGVYGRKAGSVGDFSYSDALKGANIVWDDKLLDRWLTNTDAVAPDNDMAFRVSNPEERAAIIQFLKATSGK